MFPLFCAFFPNFKAKPINVFIYCELSVPRLLDSYLCFFTPPQGEPSKFKEMTERWRALESMSTHAARQYVCFGCDYFISILSLHQVSLAFRSSPHNLTYRAFMSICMRSCYYGRNIIPLNVRFAQQCEGFSFI